MLCPISNITDTHKAIHLPMSPFMTLIWTPYICLLHGPHQSLAQNIKCMPIYDPSKLLDQRVSLQGPQLNHTIQPTLLQRQAFTSRTLWGVITDPFKCCYLRLQLATLAVYTFTVTQGLTFGSGKGYVSFLSLIMGMRDSWGVGQDTEVSSSSYGISLCI